MKWTRLPFGRYAGKTLPKIAFVDPDWLFWLLEEEGLNGPLAREAALVERRATRIILKELEPGGYRVDWVFDRDGEFSCIEIVSVGPEMPPEPRCGRRTKFIDLSLLRARKEFDRGGYKRLIRQVRQILFPNDDHNLTKKRCEAFFDDPGNFG